MALAAPDVYLVLQADPAAPWAELQRRYRRRARELHPDGQPVRPPDQRLAAARATALFAELQAAWAEVSTPERRAAYDQRRRPLWGGVGRAPAGPRATPGRPARPAPPAFGSPLPVGVVEQTAPGGLHIVVPGRAGELSLAGFAAFAAGRSGAVLVGEIPAQPELRAQLRAVTFVERLRLTTMVGLPDLPEPRDHIDDDHHLWKVEHVRRAFDRWAAAFPGRRHQLPYADDLLCMARLSLGGYQLNPPHPAGLWGAVEPPATSRDERAARRDQPTVELDLGPPALVLLAAWAGDRALQHALGTGLAAAASAAGPDGEELSQTLRSLARPRARADGHAPVPEAGVCWGRPGPGLRRLLTPFPTAHAYLEGADRPRELPWGAPLAACGSDRDLADAGSRLVTQVMAALAAQLDHALQLVSRRGARLSYRVGTADPAATRAAVVELVAAATQQLVGFPARAEARLQAGA
ncbi:MAG TPA: DnaJ domain-containing protein [Verrucomicrobiae bacterium]|nr:DnaJ domain-containing protein [Verrucomicrobiae bacterium]